MVEGAKSAGGTVDTPPDERDDRHEEHGPDAKQEQVFADPERRDLDQKEQFKLFTVSLMGALSQNTLYAPNHPQAKQALIDMARQFELAIEGRPELTYVAIGTREGEDMLVEGYFDQPTRLMKLLPGGMGGLQVPRLLRYFKRHRIFSLTLLPRLRHDELARLVALIVGTSSGQLRELAPELTQNPLDGVRVLFQRDLVRSKRDLSWRTRLTLTRLVKDTRKLALFKNLSDRARGERLTQLLEDVLRPIRQADVMADLLVNLDLVAKELTEYGIAKPAQVLSEQTTPELCGDVLVELGQRRKRLDRGPVKATERSDLGAELVRLTQLLVRRLARDDRSTTTDFIEAQMTAGLLAAHDLPATLRSRLERRMKARRVLREAEDHVTLLEAALGVGDPDVPLITEHMDTYRELSRELLHIGGGRFLAEVSIALRALQLRDQTPHRIRALIPEALRATAKPLLLDTLHEMFRDAERPKDKRMVAANVLSMLGPRGVAALVEAMCQSDDRWVRRTSLDALLELGGAAEFPALEQLGRLGNPWFVVRNLLMVLEAVGTARSAMAVACMLDHDDARVRATAVPAYAKLIDQPGVAEARLLGRLNDEDEEVRIAVVEQLGKLSSRHPELGKLYAHILDPEHKHDFSERSRNTVCVAIARTGNFPVDYDGKVSDLEQVLCRALGGGQQKILFVKLRRKAHFEQPLRELLCKVLGQVGAQQAQALLAQIADDDDGIAHHARAALLDLKKRS